MAALASDWLRHFRFLLWNRWMEFNETWQEARSQCPLISLCFSGRSEKQDGRPSLWLAERFLTSPLKPLNGIQRNLTGSKISTSSTKFVFFWADRKNKMPTLATDCLRYFLLLLLNRWMEFNQTWQEARSQSPLPSLCFRADRKNKMAALASDWLRHFLLLLWNRWTEFNETWQEARYQGPLPSLCFSGRSEKQDGRPSLWLAETFSTSPLKPLNGIQRNLTGSKISTSSTKFVFFGPIRKQDGRPGLCLGGTFLTCPLKPLNGIQRNFTGSRISTSSIKFVFFGPIGKTRWPSWPLIGWDIFDFFYFSSETTKRNSTKLERKQYFNVLYQVYVFRADQKNKMAVLASDLLGIWLLLWNCWTEFNETLQEARYQCPLQSLCFSGWSVNKKCPPWPISQRDGTLYSGAR